MLSSATQPFHFWRFFFSLNGRVTRLPFAFFILPLKLLLLGLSQLMSANAFDMSVVMILTTTTGALKLMLMWPMFAVTFKRLHDIGLSGLYGLAMFVPLLVNFITSFLRAGTIINGHVEPMPDWAGHLIGTVFYAEWAFILILAAWLGNAGQNRYGKDPRQPVMDTSEVF